MSRQHIPGQVRGANLTGRFADSSVVHTRDGRGDKSPNGADELIRCLVPEARAITHAGTYDARGRARQSLDSVRLTSEPAAVMVK